VNGAQVRIFKQTDQVSLGGLLQSQHSRALKPQIGLEVLYNLPHQPLKRKLANQKLSRLLVLANLRPSPAQTCEQPWWPTASRAPCLRWTSAQSACVWRNPGRQFIVRRGGGSFPSATFEKSKRASGALSVRISKRGVRPVWGGAPGESGRK
jgi:hypothetical protein